MGPRDRKTERQRERERQKDIERQTETGITIRSKLCNCHRTKPYINLGNPHSKHINIKYRILENPGIKTRLIKDS